MNRIVAAIAAFAGLVLSAAFGGIRKTGRPPSREIEESIGKALVLERVTTDILRN